MKVDVVWVPEALNLNHVEGRSVAVFDVLRATTTITAALSVGVKEIHIFRSIEDAKRAAGDCNTPVLLCGEQNCLPPAGFDLGNSPGRFGVDEHQGKVLFMATTNGTKALAACSNAALILPAALVNASAVAAHLAWEKRDVTLLCAGTNGQVAMEDMIGAGAVLNGLKGRAADVQLESDTARIALQLFTSVRSNLETILSETTGGKNVRDAGLVEDIAFAARLDSIPMVGRMRLIDGRMCIQAIS